MAAKPGCLFIQFAREPVVGAVKTRMNPHLSPEQACQLHCELVLWTCRNLLAAGQGAVELCVAGETDHPLFQRCRESGVAAVTRQHGANLGERMYEALVEGLSRYSSVVLVGSDCPGIDGAYLAGALQGLQEAPLVFGPANDGGYVLVGASRVVPEIFAGISWGSDRVYGQTVAALQGLGLPWRELPFLADIDRPEDLPLWQAIQQVPGSRRLKR